MGKRGATTASSPMKKLKKSHPINVNLGKVEEALHDHDVDVPGSKLSRKMLIEALPRALGDGAAADERHAYQTIIVSAIGEIFGEEVKKWTAKVASAQGELETANSEKASKDAVLAEKTKTLDDKKNEIHAKKEKHAENKHALKDAEHALKQAISEVDHFDDNLKKKEIEKTKFETAVSVTLAGLIKGEYENPKEKKAAEGKGVETLREMLGEAGAADSLTTCFHAALIKKPEDRGTFDKTVIGQVEKRMGNFISSLASELAQGPATKEKKQAESHAAEEKKTACIAAQEASAEALKVAESEKPDLDAAAKSASHDVKEIDKIVEGKVKKLAKEQSGLDYATQSLEAFKFLAERPAEAPEEEKKEEEKEAMDVEGEA